MSNEKSQTDFARLAAMTDEQIDASDIPEVTEEKMANAAKRRVITLTDQPPVRISDEEWPEIAHGYAYKFDGEYQVQANRKTKVNIRVRKHSDGRAIVYGIYEYETRWQGERDATYKSGYVIDAGNDVVAAIRTVGKELVDLASTDDTTIRGAILDCISDLPPEDI